MTTPNIDKVDVVIVGAGLAGLVAASELERSGAGVRVVEATDEVGGRTKTRTLQGVHVDLGGEHVGKWHSRMQGVLEAVALRLQRTKRYRQPTTWFTPEGRRVSYLPALSLADAAQVVWLVWRLNRLSRRVRYDSPWLSPHAEAFDALSLGDWLRRQRASARAYGLFGAVVGGFCTLPIDQVSFLHALWWVARSGGVIRAVQDGQRATVVGGIQELPVRLAARLKAKVVVNAPVTAIRQDSDEVVVETSEGSYRCKHAIVTAPIPTLTQIAFVPRLPDDMNAMLTELAAPQASAVTAVYEKEEPSSRLAVGGPHFPLVWRDGRKVMGITSVPSANLSSGKLTAELLGSLEAPASQPSLAGSAVQRWGELPYSQGTYVIFRPGQLVRYGPMLRVPHGRVHFAGAERSTWVNSMEGALESGAEVAARVAELLGCKASKMAV